MFNAVKPARRMNCEHERGPQKAIFADFGAIGQFLWEVGEEGATFTSLHALVINP
jgi:hypothetical protein